MAKTSMIDKENKRRVAVSRGKYHAVRLHNRCRICGRPRGYYRDFGLCRCCLRKMAHEGVIPGLTKSSW
jgi:small subunit ribosomal protein S14